MGIPSNYPLNDEISLEPLFNTQMSEDDGTKKNMRIIDMQNVVSGYMPCDRDDAGTGTTYDGFQDKGGNWYIMQTTTVGSVLSYRYFAGTSNYSTNWTNRIGLAYDYFSVIF